jgi:hypothetical protein
MKRSVFFIVVIFSLFFVVQANGWQLNSENNSIEVQKNIFLAFKQPPNLSNMHPSLLSNMSTIAYWNLDNCSQKIAYDSSNSGLNGTVHGATNVPGKYANGLYFNGSNSYVNCGYTPPPSNAISMTGWVNSSSTQPGVILSLDDYHRFISITNGTSIVYWWKTANLETSRTITLPSSYIDGRFHFVAFTYDNITGYASIYWDGEFQDKYYFGGSMLPSPSKYNTTIGARQGGASIFMSGTVDDIHIFNLPLTSNEVMAMYSEEDPMSFSDYYYFADSASNCTMILNVNWKPSIVDDSIYIYCENFFINNRLTFWANSSANLNIWTNLGRPDYTTGVWNGNNNTNSLAVNSSENFVSWNTYNIFSYTDGISTISPSNVTVPYGANETFNFNTSIGYRFDVIIDGESMGQIDSYSFFNVTDPHIVKVFSTPLNYTISGIPDSGSMITPSGNISVSYGGSQSYSFQNKAGSIITHVYIDNIDVGRLTNYTFKNVTDNHSILVTSQQMPVPTQGPSPSPSPSPLPSINPNVSAPTPNSTMISPGSPELPLSTIAPPNRTDINLNIAMVSFTVLVIFFVVFIAFNKGYIRIDILDEAVDVQAQNKSENINAADC